MDAGAKEVFDEKYEKGYTEMIALDSSDAVIAGQDIMTTEARTVYDAEWLKWKKDSFELCELY